VHPCIICFKWSQLGAHYFLVHLFQLLYMFRATLCPSSGDLTVSLRHRYFLQPPIQSEKIPVWHIYNNVSWWWAHSCPKHVENFKINIPRSTVNLVGFIWKRLYGYMFMYVCMHACMCACVYAYVSTFTCVCVCVYICICVSVGLYMCGCYLLTAHPWEFYHRSRQIL
jgi:hypothetical protein